MRHPAEGALRRLLDEPAGVSASDRLHVAGCAHCAADLTAAREDADLVGSALAPPDDSDLEVAWSRLSAARPTAAPGRAWRTGRTRSLVQRPAAAGLAVAVVLAGAGTAAANDWLPVFRTEKVAPVSLSTADLLALPDLSAYGELAATESPDVHEVRDAATAKTETGLEVPEVADLPKGVVGEPALQVGRRTSLTFTFDSARAAAAAAEAGESLPPVPAGLDGSRLRLVAGPGVAQVWSSASGAPALVVARAVAPTAFSSGVPFEAARDYLLSLPGLPAEVATQLRAFAGDGSTLPLPVPADRATSTPVEVDGRPATLLVTRDRTLAAVVWISDGVVTLVAGSLDDDEVLTVAQDLR